MRPAKAWDERDTDKLGRVQAEKGEDGDDAKDGIRVSRWLADRGAASRREADDWIARGWVTVDGEVALLGQRVLLRNLSLSRLLHSLHLLRSFRCCSLGRLQSSPLLHQHSLL